MADKFVVWIPGGTNIHLPLEDARAKVRAQMNDVIGWEIRIPGVDMETTWNQEDQPVKTLMEAIEKALPRWPKFGLFIEDAALLLMEMNVIMTVGEGFFDEDLDDEE